ncbi:MAG: PQQ-binding-like beta-propeller repeat protein [Verrucomicrobiales bacterium]|nr:PQQ-binding-like beta-propeller repeat protein [Verrucomicrobiales bacterium]
MKIRPTLLLFTLSILIAPAGHAQAPAESWHQWRGPENNGISPTAKPPVEWSEERNLRWKAEIQGNGTGSPIVWGDKVFVTTSIDTGTIDPNLPKPEDQPERVFGIKYPNTSFEMVVLCFDRRTGKPLWREVARTLVPHEGHHKDASFASASPFCDGERLYCWFGSAGLFAYSLEGKKLWERDLGPAKIGASLGEGSSPVVHDGKLVLVRDHAGQSTIECLDATNGKTLWKMDRDEGNAWATPAIAVHDGVTQVITCASKQIRSYDLETGEILWWATGLTGNCTPCPIVQGDTVYCMSGYEGHALLAIPITGKGDVTDQIRWKADSGTPYVPSPLLYDDQLYFTQSNQGILSSLKATDGGEVFERTRISDLGDIYASPVGADGRIYFTGRKGTTVVIEHGKDFKVLATNQLDDNFHASPALSGKQLFLRGMRFLYCLEEGGKVSGTPMTTAPAPEKESPPADPKKALSDQLRKMVESGKITGEESIELYLSAFPGEKENVKRWLADLQGEEETRKLLEQVAKREIPKDYPGGEGHQPFVDKWFENAPPEKAAEVGRLWKEHRRLFPDMENKGESFIRILDYVRSVAPATAGGTQPPAHQSSAKDVAAKKANPHIKKLEKAEIWSEPGRPAGGRGSVSGLVSDQGGKPMGGVMVSAFDTERRMSTSVFSQPDGSFRIDELAEGNFRIRARLLGQLDRWIEDVKTGANDLAFSMEPATGMDLEYQRPGDDALSMLHFDNVRDRLNFKMMCAYCHQIGTRGFRTPEKPVDWETMIRRMDGFGGLYPHTQETIVQRILDAYSDEAVKKWPPYQPSPAPSGMAANAKITAWEMGEQYEASFHDLDIGPDDGLAYVVHIGKQYTATLDPETTERIYYKLPRGSQGPHSIEPDNEGQMWLTLCVSGEMAKFDLKTKEYTIVSSAEPPAERGSWPHTLRVDPKDPESFIWYTDAGRNSVFRLHPKTLERKEFHLLDAGQVKAGGKGESNGVTPYGLDYSPVDGKIWYSKLNGNRIGRIDPKAPDGDITEWNPPFRGPRRLHVAPDGMVWVPGFGSGVFGKFDPNTEEWTVYPLPNYQNQIPYALNVAPDGMVWICGTGNDTLYRFNPETEYLVEFRLPTQVSYTREIEFDAEGNVWTSTSNAPVRHIENACGEIIKLEILDKEEKEMGGVKLIPIELSLDEQGILTEAELAKQAEKLGELFVKIEARELPKDYPGGGPKHQAYVERIMQTIPEDQRDRVGQLFNQRRKLDIPMEKPGNVYIKILDFVAWGDSYPSAKADTTAKPKPVAPASAGGPKKESENMEQKTGIHRLDNPRRSLFDAFVYVNRIPDKPLEGESAFDFAGRIHGRLDNQEGRVLLKLSPGMDRAAYDGFKTFLGVEGDPKISNCAACHAPADFAISSGGTLRNREWATADLESILRGKMAKAESGNPDYAALQITEADLPNLIAFQRTLKEVGDDSFRDLILSAEVVDVTATPKEKPGKEGPSSALTGTVRFEGPRPKPRQLPLDEASRKLHDGAAPLDEAILIGESGGLANVFVYLKNPPEGDYPTPGEAAVIDQEGSIFRPRVQGLRVGQEVLMKNGDPFIHNIRSLSQKNRPFNIAQPAGSPEREKTFETAEGPITIKCDFHPWMTAHFWVMEHPFFAVTDSEGKFTIPGLPLGEYTLAAWHELLGTRETTIQVNDSSTPVTTLSFQPKE